MAKITYIHQTAKMTDVEFVDLVRAICADSANVKFSRHAIDRMREREITRKQVLSTLRSGHLTEPVHLSIQGDWKGTFSHTTAGDRINVAATIKKVGKMIVLVITTF